MIVKLNLTYIFGNLIYIFGKGGIPPEGRGIRENQEKGKVHRRSKQFYPTSAVRVIYSITHGLNTDK